MDIFLVVLRETLEAAIIVGMIFGILDVLKLGGKSKLFVAIGVCVGVIFSIATAWGIRLFLGELPEEMEKIFEGILMLIAVGMITHFILWTNAHFKNIGIKVKSGIEKIMSSKQIWLLSILAFVSVSREGVETAIFLNALDYTSVQGAFLYAIVGLGSALTIAFVLFRVIKTFNISSVLRWSNIFFFLLAAGLLGRGITELEEGKLVPELLKPLYDFSPIISEDSFLGELLHAIFSYEPAPSLTAVILYIGYIVVIGYIVLQSKKTQRA